MTVKSTTKKAYTPPIPFIESVMARPDYHLEVSWAEGARKGKRDVIDLTSVIKSFKLSRALRNNPALFEDVHVDEPRLGVYWGNGNIDISGSALEQLAEEQWNNVDFNAFLQRNRLSLTAAAAELGISRRQVAYFAADKAIPRTIVLACIGYEARLKMR